HRGRGMKGPFFTKCSALLPLRQANRRGTEPGCSFAEAVLASRRCRETTDQDVVSQHSAGGQQRAVTDKSPLANMVFANREKSIANSGCPERHIVGDKTLVANRE